MSLSVDVATEADRSNLIDLVREMVAGVDPQARLRWLYDQNPAGRALTWIAREGNEIAGVTSYFPCMVRLDGRDVMGAFGGDGYVRPSFRRRGVGGMLHAAAREAMPSHGISCMYGAPGAMNLTPLKHGGSREVGHVVRWARPLRGAALGLRRAPFDQLIRGILRPRRGAQLVPMLRDDARVDEVWRAAAPGMKLGAARDAVFYTWRFLDSPAQRQRPYVILQGGEPIAACALEQLHGGARIHIVDLMAIPGAWHTALAAISRYAAETDASILDIKLLAVDGRARGMWRSGFIERDNKPFLVVIPEGGDRRFLDPLRWYYGGADSDLDTLE
jgi:GNAT superfamily N-acetyltransferase